MQPSKELETFENPRPDRKYTIEFTCPEFTSVCRYVPGLKCIELKSLKLYFWSYRNEGIFYEAVTNRILDDLVAACDPTEMTVIGKFNVRGGIAHEITATYPHA